MPAFKGGTSVQAPLRLQVRPPIGVVIRVYSIYAAGENDLGAASRVAVTKPGTVGTGNSLPIFPVTGNGTSQCTLSDTYSVGSSLPFLAAGPFALPILVRWECPPSSGIVIGSQNIDASLLLYAKAEGDHTWSGELVWEEA